MTAGYLASMQHGVIENCQSQTYDFDRHILSSETAKDRMAHRIFANKKKMLHNNMEGYGQNDGLIKGRFGGMLSRFAIADRLIKGS